jgi:hypothetical protein
VMAAGALKRAPPSKTPAERKLSGRLFLQGRQAKRHSM